ncbi:hypothetical protein FF011L_17290 [Roseimaritima multifibrata]|uniref:Uncharacterized protein n=1 Tax=Roseimaritima multifibrata TaxID=1930274 RepID=A0A517MDL0_9BACT|nr:hypothetical protein [Roseimaritima multifibrata]QDS92974.1 hypothetical protein FF011L_17290 [Roseimaritima multifibrata]
MIALQPTQIDYTELRQLVTNVLADLGQLEPNAFPLTERVVVKKGEACGIYFCLHGPRNVKLTAICDLQKKNVIYYGGTGTRDKESAIPLQRAA